MSVKFVVVVGGDSYIEQSWGSIAVQEKVRIVLLQEVEEENCIRGIITIIKL